MDSDNPAVLNVLRRSMISRLATLSRTGRPSINPLYFLYLGGRIWLGTCEWTLAARNVKADPWVSVLFEVEQDRSLHRVLRIRGQASVRTDPKFQRSYNLRVARKYVLTLAEFTTTWPTFGNSSPSMPITPRLRRKARPASSRSSLSKLSSSTVINEGDEKAACSKEKRRNRTGAASEIERR